MTLTILDRLSKFEFFSRVHRLFSFLEGNNFRPTFSQLLVFKMESTGTDLVTVTKYCVIKTIFSIIGDPELKKFCPTSTRSPCST